MMAIWARETAVKMGLPTTKMRNDRTPSIVSNIDQPWGLSKIERTTSKIIPMSGTVQRVRPIQTPRVVATALPPRQLRKGEKA